MRNSLDWLLPKEDAPRDEGVEIPKTLDVFINEGDKPVSELEPLDWEYRMREHIRNRLKGNPSPGYIVSLFKGLNSIRGTRKEEIIKAAIEYELSHYDEIEQGRFVGLNKPNILRLALISNTSVHESIRSIAQNFLNERPFEELVETIVRTPQGKDTAQLLIKIGIERHEEDSEYFRKCLERVARELLNTDRWGWGFYEELTKLDLDVLSEVWTYIKIFRSREVNEKLIQAGNLINAAEGEKGHKVRSEPTYQYLMRAIERFPLLKEDIQLALDQEIIRNEERVRRQREEVELRRIAQDEEERRVLEAQEAIREKERERLNQAHREDIKRTFEGLSKRRITFEYLDIHDLIKTPFYQGEIGIVHPERWPIISTPNFHLISHFTLDKHHEAYSLFGLQQLIDRSHWYALSDSSMSAERLGEIRDEILREVTPEIKEFMAQKKHEIKEMLRSVLKVSSSTDDSTKEEIESRIREIERYVRSFEESRPDYNGFEFDDSQNDVFGFKKYQDEILSEIETELKQESAALTERVQRLDHEAKDEERKIRQERSREEMETLTREYLLDQTSEKITYLKRLYELGTGLNLPDADGHGRDSNAGSIGSVSFSAGLGMSLKQEVRQELRLELMRDKGISLEMGTDLESTIARMNMVNWVAPHEIAHLVIWELRLNNTETDLTREVSARTERILSSWQGEDLEIIEDYIKSTNSECFVDGMGLFLAKKFGTANPEERSERQRLHSIIEGFTTTMKVFISLKEQYIHEDNESLFYSLLILRMQAVALTLLEESREYDLSNQAAEELQRVISELDRLFEDEFNKDNKRISPSIKTEIIDLCKICVKDPQINIYI